MKMIIEDSFSQYSDSWWKNRCGLPTASRFHDIITPKGEPSKSAEKYLHQLATEHVTGVYAGSEYASAAMKRGMAMEDEARRTFELVENIEVRQVGLIYPDEQKKYGASPDGLLPDSGLEIFCPESPNAVYCLLNPDEAIKIAKKYQQIQGSLYISKFKHWWFESYYPGLPPLILKVPRDEVFISKLKIELDKFVFELAKVTKQLKAMQEAQNR